MESAVKQFQSILSTNDPRIVVDGIIGPATVRAYVAFGPEIVDGLARDRFNKGVGDMLVEPGYTDPQSFVITRQDLSDVIDYVCSVVRRVDMASHLRYLVTKEALSVQVGPTLYYFVLSKNGSSRGLGQIQPGAWKDSSRVLGKLGIRLPRYEDGVYQVWTNILASVGYLLFNESILRKNNVPITSRTLYLAHNQGAGYFTRGARTNVAGQSKEVQDLIKRGYKE